MVLIDVDFLVEDILVLTNKIKAFDSHGEVQGN
jgi:hypothetical protein